jgi:ribonuclease BN (tRNA processing enzyme)
MAGVKKLAMFHHSPDHDDRTLEQALRRIRRMKLKTQILLPHEGSVISV